MNDLQLPHLHYFVAVAEELHFGRAAERLGMAQPPLSRAIRAMERRLGVTLLERTTRSVSLTPAGEVLLRDGRTALDAIAAAVRRTQQAGLAEPVLRLALKADYDGGLLPQVLAAYTNEPAALPVELVIGRRGEQEPVLRDGRADIALLPHPFNERNLDVEPFLTEPRLLAVAATDPLASQETICLVDLVGRTLPDGRPVRLPGTAPGIASPTPEHSAHLDLSVIFNLVELGRTVWFPPRSLVRRHLRPGIAYRVVTDLPPLRLSLAWPEESRSPAVAAFVRTASSVAAQLAQEAEGVHQPKLESST